MIKSILFSFLSLILLIAYGCTIDTADGGGSETWGVTGCLIDTLEATVDGAEVDLYLADTSAGASAVASITSDTAGEYHFDSTYFEKSKSYFIIARYDNNSLTALVDRFHYTGPDMQMGTDTLKAPGSIAGTVRTYDSTTVGILCYIPGTSFAAYSDESGAFLILNVPAGIWNVYYSANGYERAKDTAVIVVSGEATELPIRFLQLDPSGTPPSPETLLAEYDSLSGTVLLLWNSIKVSDLKGYEIFADSGNSGPQKISGKLSTDTVFTDTIRVFSSDTAPVTIAYQVRSVDSSSNTGPYSNPVTITVFPRPLPGSWISGTELPVNRRFMIAGTIGNQIIAAGGDYTITGGTTNRTISSNLSFAYSLENQTWSEADTMYCGHSAGTSATFNGKLYVFGGYTYNSSNRSNELTAVVECYDPDAEKWDSVCIMPEAFKGSAAVVFKNSIFILGGESQLSVSNSIYEFIPSSSSWVFAGRLMQPRSFHQAVLLNEEIYITGGWDGMGTIIKSTEVFTPGFTNTSSGSKMNRARCNFCAVEIDGRIYAFGGIDETGNVENGIELFDTKTSAWTVIGNMSNPVHAMAAVECHGKIMIIGGSTEGYSGFNESSIMEIYYP